ncbi:uncharacterized protein LOC115749756 [Rhodamnia argentea]|uniref:Uncharacterized protein LOC115749756 n=1 Tax=Rhodamnia argentea TaxID=178133 RepID=A0A8B8Q659_9MYRT|nr:uncharacterized protein LOC115749756 [Rhodamnia argentea]
MGMARSLVGRTLAVALPLLFLLSITALSSATPPPSRARKLGFFYTRTRGRCTPQYWSSGREKWPRMVPRKSTVSRAFGSRAIAERYGGDLTVWESTAGVVVGGGDAYGRLVKQASAALLNSYARKGFTYSAWEVKTLLIQALASPRAAADQAGQFAVANEACN